MFKQALMFEPQAVTVLVNLGSVYFAEHKYKQGTEVYEKALPLNPNALHPDPRAAVGDGTKQEPRPDQLLSPGKASRG